MEAAIQKGVEALAGLVRWVRGERVMLDADLARLYGVETKALKRAVTRNRKRFPGDFVFILARQEVANLICQIGISSSRWGGRRKPTLAFTEQGVAMLSSVLRSDRAADVNIAIMRTFVQLRRLMDSNRDLARKISEMEKRYDEQFWPPWTCPRPFWLVVPRRGGFALTRGNSGSFRQSSS